MGAFDSRWKGWVSPSLGLPEVSGKELDAQIRRDSGQDFLNEKESPEKAILFSLIITDLYNAHF